MFNNWSLCFKFDYKKRLNRVFIQNSSIPFPEVQKHFEIPPLSHFLSVDGFGPDRRICDYLRSVLYTGICLC